MSVLKQIFGAKEQVWLGSDVERLEQYKKLLEQESIWYTSFKVNEERPKCSGNCGTCANACEFAPDTPVHEKMGSGFSVDLLTEKPAVENYAIYVLASDQKQAEALIHDCEMKKRIAIAPVRNTPAEIQELSTLATMIVREHFDPLIGPAQNDYMLARFQSVEALTEQLANGYRYYWVLYDDLHVGFLAFFPKDGRMYLSKFYVHKRYRGRHIAGEMMEFLKAETQKEGLGGAYLNVNRNNTDVIEIYRHFGFEIIREEKNDIGNGFYMDDFVLAVEW